MANTLKHSDVLVNIASTVAIESAIVDTPTVNVAQTPTGGVVTRTAGSWADDGFLVGHLVTVEMGEDAAQYRVLSISDNGLEMALEGASLAGETGVTKTFWVQGPHGGLTVVHGGGNMPLEITGPMNPTTADDNILTVDC